MNWLKSFSAKKKLKQSEDALNASDIYSIYIVHNAFSKTYDVSSSLRSIDIYHDNKICIKLRNSQFSVSIRIAEENVTASILSDLNDFEFEKCWWHPVCTFNFNKLNDLINGNINLTHLNHGMWIGYINSLFEDALQAIQERERIRLEEIKAREQRQWGKVNDESLFSDIDKTKNQ